MAVTGAARKQAGLYYDKGGAVYNVMHPDFGAKADSVTDDTAAINAALAAAVGGGIVYFPAGIYKLLGTLTVTSGIKLRGTGKSSILNGSAVTTNPLIAASTQSYVSIEDLYIDGGTTGAMAIQLNTVTNFVVRRCTITGFQGLVTGLNYGGGVFGYLCDDSTIEDCDFSNNGHNGASGTGWLTSDIQINGNGVAADCTKRVKIHNNRCLSTLTQTNIAVYDVAYSVASENICSGAKCQSSNNNGYGIMFYKTVNANAGAARRNRVVDNLIYSVTGTGIYMQSQNDYVVAGNVIEDAASVQSDNTLQAGGISCSNSPNGSVTGNSIFNCGCNGIVFGGISPNCYGFTIMGNEIDTVTVANGLGIGIKLNGPITKSSVVGNTIRNAAGSSIGTPTVDVALVGVTISANTITGPAVPGSGPGIDLYGANRCVVSNNVIHGSSRDGIEISTNSSNVDVIGNQCWDGGTATDNVYSGINLSGVAGGVVTGNLCGNTGGTGFKYGIFVNATSSGITTSGNKTVNGRTGAFSLDATVANHNLSFGNYDATLSDAEVFAVRQQIRISGQSSSVTQLLLGDAGAGSVIGTRFSGGDLFITTNAVHLLGVDTWHQSFASNQSKLLILRTNGDLEFYSNAAGTADGNFATFWGTRKGGITAGGQLLSSSVTFLQSLVALNNGAAANTATLTNAPAAGNPTKWIPINDNGTTRYIPTW